MEIYRIMLEFDKTSESLKYKMFCFALKLKVDMTNVQNLYQFGNVVCLNYTNFLYLEQMY